MDNFIKLNKGQQVFEVIDYDRRGTYVVRLLEVMSCGKKQMTAFYVEDDRMAKRFYYPNSESGYERFYDAAEHTFEELQAKYLPVAEARQVSALASAEKVLADVSVNWAADSRPVVRDAAKVDRCKAPARVINYKIACEETELRVTAEMQAKEDSAT